MLEEHGRTRETMKSWDHVTGPQRNHPMSPQKGKRTLEVSGMKFKPHLEDPTRYQRDNIRILDKLTAHAWDPIRRSG